MANERDKQRAHPDERVPMNNSNCPEKGDLPPPDREPTPEYRIIKTKPAPKTGCYVSKVQGCICCFGVLGLVAGVAVAAAILSARFHCDCTKGHDWEWIFPQTPKATVAPNLPWSSLRLPDTLKPLHYSLSLRINLERFVFNGSVDIDLLVQQPTEYIIVHVNELDVDEGEVTVTPLAGNRSYAILRHVTVPINQFHVLHMAQWLVAGQRLTVRFGRFQGVLKDDLRGLYRSMYKENGKVKYLAASQLQSVDARKVFPCFDEPHHKANFSVTLEHAAGLRALSNMPALAPPRTLPDGWLRTRFQTTPIMSTYLLAFLVSDFQARERTMENGLKIRMWSSRSTQRQTKYALEIAERGYKFFESYFGIREVVPKADHVAIPDFSAGAMENWGLVLYRETAMLHDEQVSSISNKYFVSLVMCHEIAHTWFGNMVTMDWWDDLWLNEGFANTLMYFALDHIYPEMKVYDLQLINNVYPVMTKDSLLTSHAISTPIRDPDDIPQFFDSISYDKGMAVLRLLRGFLGWSDFQTGLQKYVSKYKFKNAKMADLWQTFSEAVGNRYHVGRIMDTWTRQMGFPVVTVRHVKNNKYLLEQKRFLLNPKDTFDLDASPFSYKWYIPFTYVIQGRKKAKTEWLNMSNAEIRVPKGRWILGNVDYMGFYRVNYDRDIWEQIIAQLHRDSTVFSAASRAGLISDAFNLARANQLNYEIVLNLTSYMSTETEFVVWQAFLDAVDFLKGMLATSNSFGLLQTYIRNLVAPMYRSIGTSDQGSLLDRNLRKSILQEAASVAVPDAVDWATRMFESWRKYGSRIPPDYAVVIYSVGIQQGGELEWNHVWGKSRETLVASETAIMMEALAHSQQPWLLWRYARWSLDSDKIRMQDVRNLFRYFGSTPLGRSVALQFLLTNWKEINHRFGMDAFLLRDIIYATTSLLNKNYAYKQLRTLYQQQPPAGVARKSAQNSLALVSSNIQWMNLHHEVIEKWLIRHVRNGTKE